MPMSESIKENAWKAFKKNFADRNNFDVLWNNAIRLSRKVGYTKIEKGVKQNVKYSAIGYVLVRDYLIKGSDGSTLGQFIQGAFDKKKNDYIKRVYRAEVSNDRFGKFNEKYGSINIKFNGAETSFSSVYLDFLMNKIDYWKFRDAVDLVKASPEYDGKYKHMGDTT